MPEDSRVHDWFEGSNVPTIPTPEPEQPKTPEPRALRVLVGGDLIPHRPSLVAAQSIRGALTPLGQLFSSADAAIANFEAATGDIDSDKSLRLVYAAAPAWLAAVHEAGLSAVTVANNHACDLGESGLRATLAAASDQGLVTLGGDEADPFAPRVIAEDMEATGRRVCAVAWTTIVNAEGRCARSPHLAQVPLGASSRSRIQQIVTRTRALCNGLVVIIHGGDEYKPQKTSVVDQAVFAAEAGADAVIIHHPHIASPVVVHATRDERRVPIFSSVGNLVTNQGESWKPTMFPVYRPNRRLVCVNGWTRLGVLADLSFLFDRDQLHLTWGVHLVWTENEHASNRAVAVPRIETRLLDPSADADIVAKLRTDAVGPVALFDDPCWIEQASLRGDRAQGGPPIDLERCSMSRPLARALTRSLARSLARPRLAPVAARKRR